MTKTPFTRTVNPGKFKAYDDALYPVFVTIQWDGKRLSLTGVEGPLLNGGCKGGAGQCSDLPIVRYATGWCKSSVDELRTVWNRWHLNDMRAGCAYQRQKWDASKALTIYYFRLTKAVAADRRRIEKESMAAIKAGQTVQLSPDDQLLANLPDKVSSPFAVLNKEQSPFYELNGPQYDGDTYNKTQEVKRAGWTYEHEHPEGILSKPCEICGYKYGSQWVHEDVPDDVLQWLESLPAGDSVCPAPVE